MTDRAKRADRFRKTIARLRLTPGAAADLLRVTDRTYRRWVSEERTVPDIAFACLELYESQGEKGRQ